MADAVTDKPKSTSLKDFLAEIGQGPIVDADPEEEAIFQQSKDQPDHYESVEKSRFRSVDEIYEGQKTSRSDLYADQDDQDEDDVPFGEVEGGSDEDSTSESESETQDKTGDQDTVPVVRHDAPAIAPTSDITKGKHIAKQLALWESLLSIRVRLQEHLTAINDQPAVITRETSDDTSDTTISSLINLNEALFQLREELMGRNLSVKVPARKKRKTNAHYGADEAVSVLQNAVSSVEELNKSYEPTLAATVTKWSDKVSAASVSASSKKFNAGKDSALFKNTWQQIQHVVQNDRLKLVARTRVKRYGEALEADYIFDDSDFFHSLLKEAADHQMLDLDDATLSALRTASSEKNKLKKTVDTKASKGRKLRYTVHEKLQNFMVPIQTTTWQDAQIDELLTSLLGKKPQNGIPRDSDSTNVATDGFRVF